MAKNVFISFRFKDGFAYKKTLSDLFDSHYDTVDYSEEQDRSWMTEDTIKKYLYEKLKRSSITIVLLTPLAINHKKSYYGLYDDWMYDEIRYSLEDRENNRTNGLIAVYTPEAANMLIQQINGTDCVYDVDNLFRKNMMNVKSGYKINPRLGHFDVDYDSYCSLIPWDVFTGNIGKYIDIATTKRNSAWKYNIVKRL